SNVLSYRVSLANPTVLSMGTSVLNSSRPLENRPPAAPWAGRTWARQAGADSRRRSAVRPRTDAASRTRDRRRVSDERGGEHRTPQTGHRSRQTRSRRALTGGDFDLSTLIMYGGDDQIVRVRREFPQLVAASRRI